MIPVLCTHDNGVMMYDTFIELYDIVAGVWWLHTLHKLIYWRQRMPESSKLAGKLEKKSKP